MHKLLTYILSLTTLLLIAGCGDDKDPLMEQTEQNRLILRLFSSMQEGNYETAQACLEKIRVLNPRENFYPTLSERLKANSEVAAAQKILDSGNASRAESALARATMRYPFDRNIAEQRRESEKLKKIELTLGKYIAETDPAAKLKLLNEISKLSSEFKTPETFQTSLATAKQNLEAILNAKAAEEARLKAEAESKKKNQEADKTANADKSLESEKSGE